VIAPRELIREAQIVQHEQPARVDVAALCPHRERLFLRCRQHAIPPRLGQQPVR